VLVEWDVDVDVDGDDEGVGKDGRVSLTYE
jgi:hypothetical protein